jgi:hemerythrin-like domain-containing protein
MSDLVNTLCNEHRAIRNLLQDAQRAGIASACGRDRLNRARALLLSHLDKEDRHLYPVLEYSGTYGFADAFAGEMRSVSERVYAFFDAYERSDDVARLGADFTDMVVLLNDRIQREEACLYPFYERVVSASG